MLDFFLAVVFGATGLDPTIVVAVVAGALTLASTTISVRSKAQGDLVDDLRGDRAELREAMAVMQARITALELNGRDTEARLLECREREVGQAARVRALESTVRRLEAIQ